jgi:hypothetical protein
MRFSRSDVSGGLRHEPYLVLKTYLSARRSKIEFEAIHYSVSPRVGALETMRDRAQNIRIPLTAPCLSHGRDWFQDNAKRIVNTRTLISFIRIRPSTNWHFHPPQWCSSM